MSLKNVTRREDRFNCCTLPEYKAPFVFQCHLVQTNDISSAGPWEYQISCRIEVPLLSRSRDLNGKAHECRSSLSWCILIPRVLCFFACNQFPVFCVRLARSLMNVITTHHVSFIPNDQRGRKNEIQEGFCVVNDKKLHLFIRAH